MMIWSLSRAVLEALFAVIAGVSSPKQWTAGAPVIGAAPVPSGKPKRLLRLTENQARGAPRILLNENTTMAAKNTLKYKRNRLPLSKIVEDLIAICLRTLESPNFKATMGDMIKLIRLKLTLFPP